MQYYYCHIFLLFPVCEWIFCIFVIFFNLIKATRAVTASCHLHVCEGV